MSLAVAPPLRRAHAVPTHLGLRRHRRDVARWALAHGHPVDRDALAVVVAVRSSMGDGTVSLRWTSDDVRSLLWSAAGGWCLAHGVRLPAELTATLATYLRYLSAHRLFSADSEPMTVLRRTLAEHDGDSSRQASRARHPAGGRRRLAPVLPIA